MIENENSVSKKSSVEFTLKGLFALFLATILTSLSITMFLYTVSDNKYVKSVNNYVTNFPVESNMVLIFSIVSTTVLSIFIIYIINNLRHRLRDTEVLIEVSSLHKTFKVDVTDKNSVREKMKEIENLLYTVKTND